MKKMTTTIPTSTILSTNFTENTYVASDTEVSFTSPYNINPIAKWLEEHAKPLKTTNPTASLNDLKPLKDMVGSASIVGLGETTHGAHEVFTMKHRIVHYLVSEKGFTNLVLEEGWDRALKLDRYVLTGKGNPNQHLSPEFNTKEIVDLINWIQEYNADPKHKSKVRVIGMDIQSVSKNIYNNIIEYVRRNNPKLLPSLEEKIKDLIPVTKDINIFSGLTKENKEKYISDAKQINALLEQNKNTLNGNSKEFAWIKQTARIIEQFTTMAASFPDNPSDFFET